MISRRGTTIRSISVNGLWDLNSSRTRRLARFRATAFPIFWLAAMPRRGEPASFDRAKQVMNRPRNRMPPSKTFVNSARRRSFTATTKQSVVCALSRGGASGRCGRSWSACGRGIHGCAGGDAGWADTYASSKILRNSQNFATREPTILMGAIPACQRTAPYATVAARPKPAAGQERPVWNLVSSQSFPHLCKNLWKIVFFCVLTHEIAHFLVTFRRRKVAEHDLKRLSTSGSG